MQIELIYYPLHQRKITLLRKKLTLPKDAKIEDVLPLVHAKALAVWQDNVAVKTSPLIPHPLTFPLIQGEGGSFLNINQKGFEK